MKYKILVIGKKNNDVIKRFSSSGKSVTLLVHYEECVPEDLFGYQGCIVKLGLQPGFYEKLQDYGRKVLKKVNIPLVLCAGEDDLYKEDDPRVASAVGRYRPDRDFFFHFTNTGIPWILLLNQMPGEDSWTETPDL